MTTLAGGKSMITLVPRPISLFSSNLPPWTELAPGNWTDCLTRVLISPTGERADKQ